MSEDRCEGSNRMGRVYGFNTLQIASTGTSFSRASSFSAGVAATLFSLLLSFVLTSCSREELNVRSFEFCPDYSAEKRLCNEGPFRHRSEDTVLASISLDSPLAGSSWKEWNHYIYFDEPLVVGLWMSWNRDASLEERTALREDLECSYEISHPESGVSIQGELEGKRLQEDGLWCFDYLGTMLGELQKQERTLNESPDPGYFPVKLTMAVESSKKHLRRELTRNILVTWR